jgi:hypothetical protein
MLSLSQPVNPSNLELPQSPMKPTYILAIALFGFLASCANNKGSGQPSQRTLFLKPFGSKEIEVDQGGKNGGSSSRSSGAGYVTGDTYRRTGMDDAPTIKSQVYAQVPDQILQFPEIHNQDRYTASAQEVEFKLVPLKDVPAVGYHPDPAKAYTADTYVSEGGQTQEGHSQQKTSPARNFMKIRSGTGEVSGMGRKLGIPSPDQKRQAAATVRSEQGEQAHYVNGIGWVGIIPQN